MTWADLQGEEGVPDMVGSNHGPIQAQVGSVAQAGLELCALPL